MRSLFTLKAEGSVLLRKLPPTKRKCDKGVAPLISVFWGFHYLKAKKQADREARSLFSLSLFFE